MKGEHRIWPPIPAKGAMGPALPFLLPTQAKQSSKNPFGLHCRPGTHAAAGTDRVIESGDNDGGGGFGLLGRRGTSPLARAYRWSACVAL